MQNYVVDASNSVSWEIRQVSTLVYALVCRSDFAKPGFALIKLADDETSIGQRRKIVELKKNLSDLVESDRGETLAWLNLSRFDQKNTTKPHRDGAPTESLLILGYEPSNVESKLSISDYSKCANELGITPDAFLQDFNPMYEKGLELLAPYTTYLDDFDRSAFQILVVNNSVAEFTPERRFWQGVLHSATVTENTFSRIINSTCVFPRASASLESEPQLDEFLQNDTVAGYG